MAKMAEKNIYVNAMKDIIQVLYTTPLTHKNHSVGHGRFNVSHNSFLKLFILIFDTENGQNGRKIRFRPFWPFWPSKFQKSEINGQNGQFSNYVTLL